MTRVSLVCCLFLLTLAGCKPAEQSFNSAKPTEPDAAGRKYLLDAEPSGAKGVIEVRANAKDGDEVVVIGRIGGDVNPWVEGKAGFLIADVSLKPCNEIPGDKCKTPWDYCCAPGLDAGIVSIKIVDADGKTVATDARTLLGVKELATVVVKGKVEKKGEAFFILARELYVRK